MINKKFVWIGIILILISILFFCYTYFFAPDTSEEINPSGRQGASIVYDNTGMKGYVYFFSFLFCVIGFVFVLLGLVKLNISTRKD